VTVHADRQEITHRFDSIAFDAQGALHTVWIDKRDLERAPKVGGKRNYRGAAIYRNVSLDGGATFGPDWRLADHSCECCRIALAVGSDGQMRALWRHVFAPDVRDHASAVLDARATAESPQPSAVPTRATFDDWHISACPHHGPSLVAAQQGGFHALWFGVRQEGSAPVVAVRYGRLNADGSPVPDSVRALPDAGAEHADLQADGARVAAVWRSFDAGRTFALQTLGDVAGLNDFPRMVEHAGRMVAVWRLPTEVRVYEIAF
jgi:muconolactone delta-isomerase